MAYIKTNMVAYITDNFLGEELKRPVYRGEINGGLYIKKVSHSKGISPKMIKLDDLYAHGYTVEYFKEA